MVYNDFTADGDDFLEIEIFMIIKVSEEGQNDFPSEYS